VAWGTQQWGQLPWGYLPLSGSPVIANEKPEPNSTGVRKDATISFTATGGGGIDLNETRIWIDGALIVKGIEPQESGWLVEITAITGGYLIELLPQRARWFDDNERDTPNPAPGYLAAPNTGSCPETTSKLCPSNQSRPLLAYRSRVGSK